MRFLHWLPGTVLVSLAAAQSATPVARDHELPPLDALDLPAGFGVDLRLPLQSSFLDSLESDAGTGPQVPLEKAPDFGHDKWTNLLIGVLESEGVTEPFDIDTRRESLHVVASPEVHERIDAILGAVERELLRTVELEAFLLPLDTPKDTAPVLDAAATTALLAAHPPIDAAAVRVPLGRRGRLGARRWQAQLYDFDVEVAEGANGADPQITRLIDGLEVGAVAHALPGDDLFLRVWSRQAQPAPEPETVTVDEHRDLTVHLPRQASSLSTGSAVLPQGGALLLGHDRHSGGLLLVRVKSNPNGGEDAAFMPIGALLAPPLIARLPQVYGPEPSGGLYFENPMAEARHELGRRPFRDARDLENALEDLLEGDEIDGLVSGIGFALFTPAAGSVRDEVERLVVEWTASRTRTVTVDMRFGLVDRAVAMQAQTGAIPFTDLLDGLAWRATGACRPGDALMVVGGEERYYLQDYDIEMATGVTTGDPIISDVFDGFTFWFLPTLARDGRITGWTDLTLVHALDDSVTRKLTWETGPRQEGRDPIMTHGELELPVASRAALRTTVLLKGGEWSLLTATGLQGTDQTLVALLRSNVLD